MRRNSSVSPYAVKSAYIQGQKSARRMMGGGGYSKKSKLPWLLIAAGVAVVVFWKKIKSMFIKPTGN
jgi:hypothetical protein